MPTHGSRQTQFDLNDLPCSLAALVWWKLPDEQRDSAAIDQTNAAIENSSFVCI